MLKRIYTFLKQDLVNSLRDNILLYMIIAPILLSFGAKLFMPQVAHTTARIVVSDNVPEEVRARIGQYAEVTVLPGPEQVVERVKASDDVGGVISESGSYRVIMEGNESADAEEVARIILSRALAGETAGEYTYLKAGDRDSSLIQYTTVLLIMMGALIGGLVASFNMIEEKENRAVKAAAVSPLRTGEYALSRGLFALLVSLIITVFSTLILTGTESLGDVLLAFLFTAPVPLILALIVGGFADNQIKALAILKILLIVYLTIPVVSIFVAEKWQFFFYPLPNYWAFKVFESVLVEGAETAGFWFSSAAAAVLGAGAVGALMPIVGRRNFRG
ncbi:MAG: ABC transporter permease [Spirochaetia bacterium]